MKVKENEFLEMTESEKQSFLAESVIQPIILSMISNEIIDPSKIDDVEYLRAVIFRNLRKTIKSMNLITEIEDDFILMAEVAIEKGKYLPAIVLIATAIEHKINIFYRSVLVYDGISNDEITSIIRRLDFNSKITWLLKLSIGIEIPDEIKKEIFSVIELRNSIVHYKAIPSSIDEVSEKDSYAKILEGLRKIDMERALRISENLDRIFETELRRISSNVDLSYRVVEILNE